MEVPSSTIPKHARVRLYPNEGPPFHYDKFAGPDWNHSTLDKDTADDNKTLAISTTENRQVSLNRKNKEVDPRRKIVVPPSKGIQFCSYEEEV